MNTNPKHQLNKDHFLNLVAVALADGKLDEQESQILQTKAEELGIDHRELEYYLAQPETARTNLPADPDEKEAFLSEVVYMMMADGHINSTEYDICTILAEEIDLRPSDLDRIVQISQQLWQLGGL